MKNKHLSTEEQLARGDGEYDSDDDPDSDVELEETPAPVAPPAPCTVAAPPAPPSGDAITTGVNKVAPVAAEETGADTPAVEKPETEEERKNREEGRKNCTWRVRVPWWSTCLQEWALLDSRRCLEVRLVY